MKKLFTLLAAVLCLLTACSQQPASPGESLSADKIYLFYSNSCPHCHDALDYLDRNYPDLKISLVNVGNRIGTPLFCMGDNYLMGWSPETEKRFDSLVKPFLK